VVREKVGKEKRKEKRSQREKRQLKAVGQNDRERAPSTRKSESSTATTHWR
jgi:hypothetical protein